MTRAERLNKKYHKLKEAGFDNKFATRFKHYSVALVNELCEVMNEFKVIKDDLDRKVFERIKDLLQRRGLEL